MLFRSTFSKEKQARQWFNNSFLSFSFTPSLSIAARVEILASSRARAHTQMMLSCHACVSKEDTGMKLVACVSVLLLPFLFILFDADPRLPTSSFSFLPMLSCYACALEGNTGMKSSCIPFLFAVLASFIHSSSGFFFSDPDMRLGPG